MADVYDGFDPRLQRRVAIKCLRPALASDPAVRARFEREAKAAARLSHPSVVGLYDIGEDSGIPFLVMERMPGQTLADCFASGPLDQAWLRDAVLQVLAALAAAHAAGILHRDIKPGNVLLGQDGRVKVADFGIAAISDAAGDEHHTSTGLIIGTPAYLAPERAQGRPATVQSDLYAVGVLLYEGLTGHKPYAGDTPLATAVAAQRGGAAPITRYRPDADPTLVSAASRAMAVRAEDRFPTASAMATALAARPPAPPTVVLPAAQTEPASASASASRPSHRLAKALVSFGTVLLLTAVVIAFWPFGNQSVESPPPPATTVPAAVPPATAVPAPTPPTSVAPVVLTPTTKAPPPPHHHRRKTAANG